ncbi:cell wall-binding repeat-containing protein [Desulfosporosinus sp. Sb-LF]|uniref:cell wall-binding repeat-containing protein n=1 Tax=Desulfosporosinus sp. Sb-LF TaxID=2560027 RepID=UPI00107F0A5F|nr:cell wall-binding repeat-containing protein [Desulfosporosinus sp. Sb-LF]TGE33808.1 cell wall-binding repeat-containing protein [Desulfosporosinus sp. Sb-LF]
MKKTKKALASLAIASMALTSIPFNAFAAGTVPTRIAGGTAAQTAVAIAEQTGWTGTAILASSASYGMVDALTSGPLATFLKAPILLQEPGAVLNADTKAELTKLNVKKVYVTSGSAVISQAVLDQLTGMGIAVESLGGADRFETSVNIAKKMVALGAPVSKVAVAYGWLNQDALSIASIASASNSPILLTEKDAVPASVKAFLAANASITSSDVIGGTGVISEAVKAALPNATRHAGNTAYDTNNQVIQDFSSSLTYGNVYVASGVTGIDALAGAPLAAASKSAIVLTNGTVPAAASFVHGKLAADSVVTALGGSAVVPETVRAGVVSGVVTPPTGNLSVTSVSAVSATDFKVVFNQAPADTSKVTFDVKTGTTPVTVTATWNAAKTEAILTNSANFPEATYTVGVKNDTTDLGTSTVAVVQQKIASINITSTKLGVVSTTVAGATKQTGYATYNVLDQYGNDITTGALANSLTFQSGVGTVEAKDGLLTLDSNVQNLMQFATVVITGYDSTSGVSVSATLTTSTQIGTLSDFQFGALTNVDGKVLTDGDTSEFYASFTATDISGNPTNNYDMIYGGLILHSDNSGNDNLLTTSNSYVTATVEKDPSDSSKAVIKVVASNSGNSLTMDMPTVITAMTWTGKTSSLNTTLKKASKVDTFTLMSPSYSIAVNEGKAIPFTALDQNGVALTKYSDLKTADLTISNAYLTENTDGTATLIAGKDDGTGFANDGQQVITATTTTGKYSSLTLNIQKYAKADELALDSSVLLSNMQSGSSQGVDFGWNYGGFTVKDQYGRVFDMVGKAAGAAINSTPAYNYEVLATTSGAVSVVGNDRTETVTNGAPIAYGANGIRIQANSGLTTTGGTGTVTFKLVNTLDGHAGTVADPYTVIDSKSVTIQVLKNTDIKDYTMDTVAKPIFADASTSTTSGAIAARTDFGRLDDYAANPYVYGKSASGSKVVLADGSVLAANVDSSDFVVTDASSYSPFGYKNVAVYAKTLGDNVTTSSTTLSVTIMGADGLVHSVTTPVTSSTASSVPTKIQAAVNTFMPGVTLNDVGDVAHVSQTYLSTGKLLARTDTSGSNANRSLGLYIRAIDQYGSKAAPLSQLIVVSKTHADGTASDFAVGSDFRISSAAPQVGDVITLSGVSSNGLVKTIKIIVTAPLS